MNVFPFPVFPALLGFAFACSLSLAGSLSLRAADAAPVPATNANTPAPAPAATSQPNIIFILTDDQGYGDLSSHGHPFLKTPNLDRLGQESVRFTDYQVSPLCSPTRCALLTGRHEFRSGVYRTHAPYCEMSLDAVTIAQVLQTAGYTTGIFGKWHLGDKAPYQPYNRGFDESLNFLAGMLGERQPANKDKMDPILLRNGSPEKTHGYDTDVFFEEATKWIGSVKGKKPFFAYIPTGAPHGPQKCPEKYEKMYAAQAGTEELAKYYGTIANIDENVGRLMDQLKDWNLERDTVLIFMSDNGANPHFKGKSSPVKVYNAHMSGAKGSVSEGGTRVPCFWRWPAGFKGGVEVDHLASNTDFFPTIAELAGAKIPKGAALDGRSLAPLLRDPHAAWPDRFVYIHTSNWGGKAADNKQGWAVRSDQYRLINGRSLFDIKADRGETKELSAIRPDVVARMRAAYDAWWGEVLPVLEKRQASVGNAGKMKSAEEE